MFGGIATSGRVAFFIAQLATYVMATVRWLETEHVSFWRVLGDLAWAACPVVNFSYVWDWWLALFSILQEIAGLVLYAVK